MGEDDWLRWVYTQLSAPSPPLPPPPKALVVEISTNIVGRGGGAPTTTTTTTTTTRHAAGKKNPEHDTHVLQGLKVLAGAVNLSGGEILYRPVFGSKFGSKKEAMQDFVASFLFRSSATAKVLHVQLATPIVKCEPAWKLRKNNVALMFNHKRTPPENTCRLRYHEHHDVFSF